MNMIDGRSDDMQVNTLGDGYRLMGSVSVRDDEAVTVLRPAVGRYVEIGFVNPRFRRDRCIPHLQKHQRIVFHCAAFHEETVVLPLSEALLTIDIFVRQIDAAAESGLSVYDEDLAVIPVIVVRGKERCHSGEYPGFDSQRRKIGGVISGKFRHASDIIVHDADFHTFFYLSFENFENRVPEDAFLYDEKFKENEIFRFFQILDYIRNASSPSGK